jgi:acylphosphatase
MPKEVECTVTGRVQMVMYRDFAARKARTLGIVGTVQNWKDGSVHVVAQGEEENLAKYIDLLKKGSTFSRVDSVEVNNKENLGKYAIFNIIF